MRFNEVMTVPTLTQGSESWTVVEISSWDTYMRGCTTSDKTRNEKIRSDLTIFSINDKIEENKKKWKDHADTMAENRSPKKL